MPREKTYELIREALAKPGCAVCRLGTESVQRYLAGFMYEDVTDVGLRAKMRMAQGFCREHAAQAVLVRDSLGLAIIYQDILSSVDTEMRAVMAAPRLSSRGLLRREQAKTGQRLAQHIKATSSCPACAVRDEMVQDSLRLLLANVLDPDLAPLYRASAGLCLPHFRQALALSGDAVVLDTIVSVQSQAINSLLDELAEFIRKHDHRFYREAMGSEADSWARALAMVIGETVESMTKR